MDTFAGPVPRRRLVRRWQCRTVRVIVRGSAPADVSLCRIGSTEFDGYYGPFDFHIRKEDDQWSAAVFERRVRDPDAALRKTFDGDTMLGTLEEVVRWVRGDFPW